MLLIRIESEPELPSLVMSCPSVSLVAQQVTKSFPNADGVAVSVHAARTVAPSESCRIGHDT